MKKTDDLSIAKTWDFAKTCYAQKQNTAGELLLPFSKKVAGCSETIAQKLFQDLRPDYVSENIKDNIAAIVHCGILHDVLNVSSCAFEQIAEVTNVQIAAMVAAISRDFRLVETKRDIEFRGRLSQSTVGAQIVVVAQIICSARATLAALDGRGLELIPRTKKILAQMDGDLLAIHAANKYYVLRLYVHAARNLLGDISQKIKECRQRAKMEKIVLQNTRNVRESAAANLAAEKPQKKRAKHYAKKRTLKSDSE